MDIDMDMADHVKRTPACWGRSDLCCKPRLGLCVSPGHAAADAWDGDPSKRLARRLSAAASLAYSEGELPISLRVMVRFL